MYPEEVVSLDSGYVAYFIMLRSMPIYHPCWIDVLFIFSGGHCFKNFLCRIKYGFIVVFFTFNWSPAISTGKWFNIWTEDPLGVDILGTYLFGKITFFSFYEPGLDLSGEGFRDSSPFWYAYKAKVNFLFQHTGDVSIKVRIFL